jgi:ComF family protein
LKSVFIATEYNGLGKKLIHHLKFERAAAAANPIAQIMMARLSLPVSPDTVISFVPTATARVRIRGYDQALLIARHLAAEARTDTFVSLLTRLGHQRQVGQTKAVRHEQLRHAFQVNDPAKVATKRVLLIDDVLTTGSTLESAAQALYEAGAEGVDAAVFAGA